MCHALAYCLHRPAARHLHARLRSRAACQWRSGSVRCAAAHCKPSSSREASWLRTRAHARACAWQSGSNGKSSPSRGASPCSTVLMSCAPVAFRQCALRVAAHCKDSPIYALPRTRAHACARAWRSGSNGKSSPSRGASPCSTALTSGAPVAFRQCALRVTAHCKPSPGCEASLCLAAHSRGTPVPARGSQAVTASPRPVTRHLHA
jgi:azurin